MNTSIKCYIKLLSFLICAFLFPVLPVQAEEAAGGLDPQLYIYYAGLSANERIVYEQALEEFSAGNAEFTPAESISPDSANRIMHAVCKDQPQLFWLKESFQYEYRTWFGDREEVTSITAGFHDLSGNLEEYRSTLIRQKDALIGDLYDLPAWQQEKLVHDRLCDLISYNSDSSYNQTLYSALCGQETVCAGYAKAFQYLMTSLGVPCYYCEGTASGNGNDDTDWSSHAWNIICLDGAYYNVDLTWNDTRLSDLGLISYAQYNRADSDPAFAGTHVRDSEALFLPACDGSSCSYESLYGIPAELGALTQLEDYASIQPVFSLSEYYDAMLALLTQYGTGEHTFRFAVYGSECNRLILHDENYQSGYLSAAVDALYLNGYSFSIETSSLDLGGEYYLITVSVSLY